MIDWPNAGFLEASLKYQSWSLLIYQIKGYVVVCVLV